MTSPLTFAEDLSIDKIRAEAWEVDSVAMIDAMEDIEHEDGFVCPEDVVILDL